VARPQLCNAKIGGLLAQLREASVKDVQACYPREGNDDMTKYLAFLVCLLPAVALADDNDAKRYAKECEARMLCAETKTLHEGICSKTYPGFLINGRKAHKSDSPWFACIARASDDFYKCNIECFKEGMIKDAGEREKKRK
jgi:hypothetical protein